MEYDRKFDSSQKIQFGEYLNVISTNMEVELQIFTDQRMILYQ